MSYTPKTDQEIRQLALDIADNKVFASWMTDDIQSLGMVFMPMLLGGAEINEQIKTDNIIHVYEYYDKAGPRSINGMPIFHSMHMLSKDDAARLSPEIERAIKMKKAFMEGEKVDG